MQTLSFNNVTKPWIYLLEGRQKAPFAPRTNSLLYVAGMPGAYIESSETGVLYITQPVGFVVEDDVDALNKVNELASWLLTSEPVPLTFSDEPNRTYYAKIDGTIEEFRKFVNQRRGTITFICPDPHKYGPELEATFPSDVTNVTINGTAPTKPIFELEVTAPITFAMIQNQLGEYMMIGKPIDVDLYQAVEKYEEILRDGMDSTVGWTKGTVFEHAVIQGEIKSNGAFYPYSFGSNIASQWYGPALKTSLSEPINNFFIQALVGFNTTGNPNMTGKIEVTLLDEVGDVVAKLSLKDSQSARTMTEGLIRVGNNNTVNRYLIDGPGGNPGQWNDFYGYLQIEKTGNYWRGYIAQVKSDGRHEARFPVGWTDTENVFTDRNVAQIEIGFARYGNTDIADMTVHYLTVLKTNTLQANEIPYIADAGDVITFDHIDKAILINGEPRKDIKQFGASYFDLQPGDNQLVVMPSDSSNTKVKYREAYK